MKGPVRILIVDNLAVESLRREVYRAMGKMFACQVHVLVPTGWSETRGPIACEPEEGSAIHLHSSRIAFGFRHQRVLYLDLPGVIRSVQPHFILAVAQPESYAAAQVCFLRRLQVPGAKLGLFSSRNIDYPREGFPYKLKFSHRLCDAITRTSAPDVCFYRPQATGNLLAPYAKRIVYAPHVVDCSLFRKTSDNRDTREKRPLVIGYVGRLVREKGVYVLLEAMRHLPEHIRLTMIGMGPEERPLRQLASEYGLVGRTDFHPPVAYGEIPASLNRMDVLVLPSLEARYWTELFGRILIEAMACEVPIVASRSGGIPEVVGDAAVLVDPGDSRALAVALDRMCLDAPARCQLGRRGRERALARYDVPIVADILGKEIIDSVASGDIEGDRG